MPDIKRDNGTPCSPLVSIIVPVYNDEARISRAIDSALAQTLENVEVIVVDDGSSDGTPEVLRRYEGKITVVRQENQDVSAARNAGIRVARGKYLCFLDSDDTFMPEKAAVQAAFMEAHPDVAVTYCGWLDIDASDGKLLRDFSRARQETDPKTSPFPPDFAPIAGLVRADQARKVGGFDEELSSAEDTHFWWKLWAEGCTFRRVSGALARRNVLPSSKSKNVLKQCSHTILASRKHFARMGPRADRRVRIRRLAGTWMKQAGHYLSLGQDDFAKEAIHRALRYDRQLLHQPANWAPLVRQLDLKYPLGTGPGITNYSKTWRALQSMARSVPRTGSPVTDADLRAERSALAYALSRQAMFGGGYLQMLKWFLLSLSIGRGRLPAGVDIRFVPRVFGRTLSKLSALFWRPLTPIFRWGIRAGQSPPLHPPQMRLEEREEEGPRRSRTTLLKSSANVMRATRPKVSIIIPVFNDEAHVADAIESALSQTYPDVEAVVVDDGSTDATPDILKRYEGKIVLVTQENQGAGGSRNAGIRASRGEYLSFLDSDDLFMPAKSEIQAELLDRHPDVGLVYGVCRAIDERDGSVIKMTRVERSARDRSNGPFPPTYPTPSFMARREWLEKVGGFNREMRWAMDTDMRFKLWAAGCVFMPHRDVVTSYRIRVGGLSTNPAEQAGMHLNALLRHFEAMGDDITENVRNEHLAMTWLRIGCGHAINKDSAEAQRAIATALGFDPALFTRYESWALVFLYLNPSFPMPDADWSPRFSEIWERISSFMDHHHLKPERRHWTVRRRHWTVGHRTNADIRARRSALAFALARREFFNGRGLAARWWFLCALLLRGGKLPKDARARHVLQVIAGPLLTRLAALAYPALAKVQSSKFKVQSSKFKVQS